MLFKLNQAGRVQLVNGERAGDPAGTRGLHRRGSTVRLQYVGEQTAKGTVVVASDQLRYLYENLEHRDRSVTAGCRVRILAAQERMRKIARSHG
mgnify:CR=1 FL=1